MTKQLTHLDEKGQALMVDISDKTDTQRIAVAAGSIYLSDAAWQLLMAEDNPNPKGDVWSTARLAGIMACKRTAEWIPLCHPLPLAAVKIQFDSDSQNQRVDCRCTVSTVGKTGVEMEALVGVQATLTTLYDMLKAVDKSMVIGNIRLLSKQGGKSGNYNRDE